MTNDECSAWELNLAECAAIFIKKFLKREGLTQRRKGAKRRGARISRSARKGDLRENLALCGGSERADTRWLCRSPGQVRSAGGVD
jgi:hypothetical protein